MTLDCSQNGPPCEACGSQMGGTCWTCRTNLRQEVLPGRRCGARELRLLIDRAMLRSPANLLFDQLSIVTQKIGCRAWVSPARSDSKRRRFCQHHLSAVTAHLSELVRATQTANGRRPFGNSRQTAITCRQVSAAARVSTFVQQGLTL